MGERVAANQNGIDTGNELVVSMRRAATTSRNAPLVVGTIQARTGSVYGELLEVTGMDWMEREQSEVRQFTKSGDSAQNPPQSILS